MATCGECARLIDLFRYFQLGVEKLSWVEFIYLHISDVSKSSVYRHG